MSINSPSLGTTPLKSAEAYSFMENLSPLLFMGGDQFFDLTSPSVTRPLNHIVASPNRRDTSGCTKSLDFSEAKSLDFGTPFSNFSTSPLSPYPAFSLPNKHPTSITPGMCVCVCVCVCVTRRGHGCLVVQSI